jgi:FG-GAP-like repeat/CARDB
LFTVQPSDQSVTVGSGATYSVAASGSPAPTYHWQRLPAGSAVWADLSDGGSYAGSATATLSVSNTTLAMNGDHFQCIATNTVSSTTSNAAMLSVNPVPVINAISYNSTTFPATAAPGATVSFTYNVTNTGTNAWGANHFLVLRDPSDNNLSFASLNGVAPGASKVATLSFTAPMTPGHYTYYVQGLEDQVAYFTARATLSLAVGSFVGDLNGDGHSDLLWENTAGVDRAIWFLNGTGIASFAYLAGVPIEWKIVGTADFNADGQTDILWENTATGDRSIWLMNGTAISDFAYLAYVDPVWHIAALGDFNGDGQTDVLWENTAGVDRAVWFLTGTNINSFGYLAGIPNEWHIVGAADFNGDGKPDIVWENTATGDRSIWLMDGTTILNFADLGNVAPAWHIAMLADFNGDGQTDLLWENRTTGDRVFWLMNGTTHTSSVYLAYVDPVWHIAP